MPRRAEAAGPAHRCLSRFRLQRIRPGASFPPPRQTWRVRCAEPRCRALTAPVVEWKLSGRQSRFPYKPHTTVCGLYERADSHHEGGAFVASERRILLKGSRQTKERVPLWNRDVADRRERLVALLKAAPALIISALRRIGSDHQKASVRIQALMADTGRD